jgi:hypothetical protein
MRLIFACVRLGALCLGLIALSACDSGRKPLPDATALVVNASPSYDSVAFLREEKAEVSFVFRQTAGFRFDADQYDFHVETTTPQGTIARTYSTSVTLDTDHEYVFVTEETRSTLGMTVLEYPLATSSTSGQFRILHVASSIDAIAATVDVHLAAPGAALGPDTVVGSVSFGATGPLQTIAAGNYELSLTATGDTASPLMRSSSFAINAGVNLTLILTDSDGIEPFAVVAAASSGSRALIDASIQSSLRIINTVSDRNPIDVVLDGEFATPLAPSIPHGLPTVDLPVDSGAHTLSVTPAGQPGTIEIDAFDVVFAAGSRYLLLVGANPGSVQVSASQDNRRPLGDRAVIRYVNGSANVGILDFFTVVPGTDLATVSPVPITPIDPLLNRSIAPGDYEITVRNRSTGTTLAGPVPVNLAAGGVYSVLAADSASNSNAVDLVLFDDFN